MKKAIKKYGMGGAPCPDCKLTQDPSTGMYKYGSDSTGFTSSSDRSLAKSKHQKQYPDAYTPKVTPAPKDTTSPPAPKMKKGGTVSKPKSSMKVMSRRGR